SYQALRTGTVNVAEYLGQSATSGTITAGKNADLVLLSGNPLEDVTHAARIEGVVLDRKWLDKGYLQKELEGLVK
ncbi:MAG: amidohydrolase family protein, partial [Bacteroidetes bacterium]|nr:amidohydrolase family protein [Bacteroidota bacterium]